MMRFRHNGEHVFVRLMNPVQPAKNRLTVVNQWTYQSGVVVKRFDGAEGSSYCPPTTA